MTSEETRKEKEYYAQPRRVDVSLRNNWASLKSCGLGRWVWLWLIGTLAKVWAPMTLQVFPVRATLAGIPAHWGLQSGEEAGLEPGCREVWSLCHLCHQQAVCPWQVASPLWTQPSLQWLGQQVAIGRQDPGCNGVNWFRSIFKSSLFHPWVGKSPWRRQWQPTPVFLPGRSHGQRSLVGYSLVGTAWVSWESHECHQLSWGWETWLSDKLLFIYLLT